MKKFPLYILLLLAVLLPSCGSDEPEPIDRRESLTLVYMLANNSLEGFDRSDTVEMRRALLERDAKGRFLIPASQRLLIYHSPYRGNPHLYELRRNGNAVEEIEIASYERGPESASGERMSEVIDRARAYTGSPEEAGLILWSHAQAWDYAAQDRELRGEKRRWFGDDGGAHINIDELARAIQGKGFRYVWADCCFMSNIETVYQLRHACNFFAGSPTEVIGDGMPYDRTLRYLMQPEADLVNAASELHGYYREFLPSDYGSNTICVIRTEGLDQVAEICRKITGGRPAAITVEGIQLYSRLRFGPYYDLTDYMRRVAAANGCNALADELEICLGRITLFKGATPKFLSIEIDPERYSGLSVHHPDGTESSSERYYNSLDWAKRIYGTAD